MTVKITAKMYLVSLLVAIVFGGLVLPAVAQSIGRLDPAGVQGPFKLQRVLMFNDNTELSSTTNVIVATLSYTVGPSVSHQLVIMFSAVGAIHAAAFSTSPATLFVGCFVDGTPCIGSQTDPGTTPAGWVNVLSTNYPDQTTWDNTLSYTWFTTTLPGGTHTVVIQAATGNNLGMTFPGSGSGTLFAEARNLIVIISQ